jgi:predicted RNase H-like HicB family nuclease
MLTDYLNAALEMAEYEIIDDPEPFYGHIPTVEGVWATGKTLESCRRNLASAVEDWVFFSVARGFALPMIQSRRKWFRP